MDVNARRPAAGLQSQVGASLSSTAAPGHQQRRFPLEPREPRGLLSAPYFDSYTSHPTSATEGAAVTGPWCFGDYDGDLIESVQIDWGDGSPAENYPGSEYGVIETSHIYADNYATPRLISFTITDSAAEVGYGSSYITVQNVAPYGTISRVIDEVTGGVTVSLNVFDPSPIDSASLHYSFSTVYDDLAETYGAAIDPASRGFVFGTPATYEIWGRVFDKDGGQRTYNTNAVMPDVAVASSTTDSEIKLTWQDVKPSSSGYRVQRSPTGLIGSFEIYANLSRGELEWEGSLIKWIDEDLPHDKRYWYRVRAIDEPSHVHETMYSPKRDATTITLGAHMTATISRMIDGKLAQSSTYDLYSSVDDSAATYTRNTNLWAADVDLSCVPVWNSFWGSMNIEWGTWANGCLVTPRHLIQAKHWDPDLPVGTVLRFVDMDDKVEVGVVQEAPTPIAGADIVVVTLTDPMPSNIKPARVFPAHLSSLAPDPELSQGLPIAMNDRFRTLRIGDWWKINPIQYEVWVRDPADKDYASWYSPLEVGDSGSAALALVGDTPVLLGTWKSINTEGEPDAGDVSSVLDDVQNEITEYSLTVYGE
jgi:hypothetical protein